jgi:hypothetical protein
MLDIYEPETLDSSQELEEDSNQSKEQGGNYFTVQSKLPPHPHSSINRLSVPDH